MHRYNIVVIAILSLMISVCANTSGMSEAGPIRVHLLGTGGPEITKHRMGVSTLIEAGGDKFLFDAGRGVLQRMGESRINIPAVRKVFFTHLHSDHIDGMPTLWMTSWFITKRNEPMEFWGPSGTKDMLDGMKKFMGHDVVARVNPVVKASGIEFSVNEFAEESLVYDRNGIKITIIQVEHGDGNPAFGYLFEYAGYSVLLTGDTTYTENIGNKVKGVDVTICNVYAPSKYLLEHLDEYEMPVPAVVRAVSAKLALPEEAGQIFAETNARMGVYSHNIFYDSTEEEIIARTKDAGFGGSIVIAEDRMVIEVGEEIKVIEPEPVPDDLEISSVNFKEVLRKD